MSGLGFTKGTNDYFSKLMRGRVDEDDEEEEEGANLVDSDDEVEGEVSGGEGEQKRGGMMFVKSTKVLDGSEENRNTADGRKAPPAKDSAGAASSRSQPKPPPKVDKEFGKFEKFTKGFGAKMLEKMGFSGRLGKHEQGIAAPIEVMVRPKNAGLGVVEEATNLKANREISKDFWGPKGDGEGDAGDGEPDYSGEQGLRLLKEAKDEFETSWMKPVAGGVQRQKRVYKTIKEMIDDAKVGIDAVEVKNDAALMLGVTRAPIKTEIIDMRGPEIKVVTNMSDIKSDRPVPSSRVVVGQELLYNVRLMTDTAGAELNQAVKKEAMEKERIVALAVDLEYVSEAVAKRKEEVSSVSEVLAIIDRVQGRLATKDTSTYVYSDSLVNVINLLQTKYASLYGQHQLVWLVGEWLPPLLSRELKEDSWDALENPELLSATLSPWKKLLVDNHASEPDLDGPSSGTGVAVFAHLMEAIAIPAVRNVIMRRWTLKETRAGVYLMTALKSLLDGVGNATGSNSTYTTDIVYPVILPRLMQEVERWDPLRDEVGIHEWLLPWQHIIGTQSLSQMLPTVRQKLSKAFSTAQWSSGDGSAQRLLKPWKSVWDDRSMYAFLDRHIVPELVNTLKHMDLHPSRASKPLPLSPFVAVLSWQPILSSIQFNALLSGEFFPKWLDTLDEWLYTQNPPADDVQSWYLGWKSVMPLGATSLVDAAFNAALDSINRYSKNAPLAPSRSSGTNYAKSYEELRQSRSLRSMDVNDDSDGEGDASTSTALPKSTNRRELKVIEIVEMFAAKAGVAFLPLPSRAVGGKQVYSLEGVSVYLDQGIVWAEERGDVKSEWRPKSLHAILAMAAAK